MTTYQHTHQSIRDHSPAMFISEDNEAGTYTLMNEDGYVWTDSQDLWISLAELEQEDYEDEHDTYTSGADYYASYINSDSYINYLNG